jgi:hypothetical protein
MLLKGAVCSKTIGSLILYLPLLFITGRGQVQDRRQLITEIFPGYLYTEGSRKDGLLMIEARLWLAAGQYNGALLASCRSSGQDCGYLYVIIYTKNSYMYLSQN